MEHEEFLLGGGSAAVGLDAHKLAQQAGLPLSVLQAAIPIVLDALRQGEQQLAAGIDLGAPQAAAAAGETSQPASPADLAGRVLSGKSIEAQFLDATGLPQELAHRTGVSHSGAVSAIQSILAALHRGAGAGGSKPKPALGSATAKPKPGVIDSRSIARPGGSGAKPRPGGGPAKPPRGSTKPHGGGSSGSRSKVPGA